MSQYTTYSKLTCDMYIVVIDTCRNVTSGNHVVWLDNFSRIYATQIPTEEAKSWRQCLWTGYAALKYNGPEVDLHIHRDEDGKFLSAMPMNLVQMSFVLFDIIADVDKHSSILDRSMVQRWRVNNIPLRPVLDEKNHPREAARLARGNDKQNILHPGGLLPENIGSNRGLLTILRNFFKEWNCMNGQDPEVYRILTVDCNIYSRIMKVSYIPQYMIVLRTLSLVYKPEHSVRSQDTGRLRRDISSSGVIVLRGVPTHILEGNQNFHCEPTCDCKSHSQVHPLPSKTNIGCTRHNMRVLVPRESTCLLVNGNAYELHDPNEMLKLHFSLVYKPEHSVRSQDTGRLRRDISSSGVIVLRGVPTHILEGNQNFHCEPTCDCKSHSQVHPLPSKTNIGCTRHNMRVLVPRESTCLLVNGNAYELHDPNEMLKLHSSLKTVTSVSLLKYGTNISAISTKLKNNTELFLVCGNCDAQVLYDPSGCGTTARKCLTVMLSPWHNYKMACMLIHREYADTVFAGLFHLLFPQQTFRKKPKYLSAVISQIQYLRLSYPTWRARLHHFIDGAEEDNSCLGHAINIKYLMEFFIPAVSHITHQNMIMCL